MTTSSKRNPPQSSQQLVFGEGGDLEAGSSEFDTTLLEYGIQIESQMRPTRLDQPSSREFIDDRPSANEVVGETQSSGSQRPLFAATKPDQWTLDGQLAHLQFLFGR